ncbi:dTDP-4-dehydrorhamnose 3,5-epimerase family protein [Escherichia coli]|uniref:dTDP-4-dehydrorhamnose 3,5-epimerase family protein n=1 Tax=Escherichia coli TaxID=562 RepID=UPI000B62C3D7|nr:dTDP-4-dehydrorhamnose 3,5-epimerase family protein [Escherichia coli]
MNVIKTEIPDVLIFEPKVFGDERGFFFESFNQKVFEEAGNDSNLLIVFYVQIMPDDFVMQLHRF